MSETTTVQVPPSVRYEFSLKDELKGYPWFRISSFILWISYKDGRKQSYYSIESKTTVSQLLNGREKEIVLNRAEGYDKLLKLIERNKGKIKAAQIWASDIYSQAVGEKIKFYEVIRDKVTVEDHPNFTPTNVELKIKPGIEFGKVIINLQLNHETA